MPKIEIRPVGQNERGAWEPLWQGYLTFYKAALYAGAERSHLEAAA